TRPQNPPPAPPPPLEPPPLNPPLPPPDPDDAGELPMVPSALIMPPKSGMALPEKRPGATPPLLPEPVLETPPTYQTGKYVPRNARPDSRSSVERPMTDSISSCRPKPTPHTTAWSGVSSQGRLLDAITSFSERA